MLAPSQVRQSRTVAVHQAVHFTKQLTKHSPCAGVVCRNHHMHNKPQQLEFICIHSEGFECTLKRPPPAFGLTIIYCSNNNIQSETHWRPRGKPATAETTKHSPKPTLDLSKHCLDRLCFPACKLLRQKYVYLAASLSPLYQEFNVYTYILLRKTRPRSSGSNGWILEASSPRFQHFQEHFVFRSIIHKYMATLPNHLHSATVVLR